ncbi:MAG: aldehyde ferredoxin oxidoreductase family protein [Deltaproteobacteria bacterium]|nr:aldehyde ferredoxin oxidoreductase family protein [Deltaproteobacteria bacterium]
MGGNFNKFLELDLGTGNIETRSIDPDYFRQYVGGSALAARIFYDMFDPETGPLEPDSPLLIMAGPLVGTNFPGTSRFVICGRSPLTGIWSESASGGFFGLELKRAGYDGIIIRGKSSRPCFIRIDNEEVSIQDAGELWGADTYETIDRIGGKGGEGRPLRVIAIGRAGENVVNMANICNDKAHYIGRTGMGALMGSKNLKAVAVRGSGSVPVADTEAYRTARAAAMEHIKDSLMSQTFHELGTAAAMELGMTTGDVPIKNWSVGEDYALGFAVGGTALASQLVKKRAACAACPIACKPVVEVDDPVYGIPEGPGPEYETLGTFGTMIMNDNLNAIAKANDLCNRLGLDTISCGATIAFIMEVYEKGLLSRQDLDGLDLTWGNIDAAIELIGKIARREGFGDRAAGGSRALARSIGGEALDCLVEVKGLELPMHDPRGFHGMGLAYMNSNRGACHLQHSAQATEQGMVSWNEVGLKDDYPGPDSTGKAEVVYISENIGQMANAVCICHFVHWCMTLADLVDGLNAVTGFDYSLSGFMEAGKRAWLLKRAINNLYGITATDDRLPKRVMTPLSEGASQGIIPDMELMKREYYLIRGLNDNGYPTVETLDSSGLGYVKQRLYRQGG